ncbi:hypothetical protein Ancab_023677 [Ancistrocladus abbreviatus]
MNIYSIEQVFQGQVGEETDQANVMSVSGTFTCKVGAWKPLLPGLDDNVRQHTELSLVQSFMNI